MTHDPLPNSAAPKVTLMVARDGWTSGIQLAVSDGACGYRIAGPKCNGSGEVLIEHTLDERDAREIRRYLDRAFPPEATP